MENQSVKKAHSGLSIVAFVFSLTIILSIVGVVLAIIDLVKKNPEKKHVFSFIALGVGGLMTILLFVSCVSNMVNGTAETSVLEAVTAKPTMEAMDAVEAEKAVAATKTPQKAEEKYDTVYQKVTVWKNSIGTVWMQAIVQIENTGDVPLYLNCSSIDVEDADGKLVKTESLVSVYPTVLLPGETAVLSEETTLEEEPSGELTVIPHWKNKKAKVDTIRYQVTEEEFKEEKYSGIKMIGRVENTSSEAESMVYIVANLFDENHHAIGQLFTILTNELQPGEKVGFELSALTMPDSVTLDSIASYEVFAFPLQYQF